MLTTPLGNRIDRPLRTAVVWGLISLGVAAAIAGLVGAIGTLVTGFGAIFGGGSLAWQGDLVQSVGAVAAPFTIASSTWAAAFLSTERMPAGRGLLATALGVVTLIVLVRLESPASLLAAAGLAWSLAIPFERWSRAATRLAAVVIPAAIVHLAAGTLVEGNPVVPWVVVATLSFPAAGLMLWIADRAWVAISVRQNAKGEER